MNRENLKGKFRNGSTQNVAAGADKRPAACSTLDPEYSATRHASYCKQREDYNSAGLEVSGRYDQWVLTLPGGALALSIVFLEKIAPNPLAQSRPWLIASWVLLVTALASGFSALYFSQEAIKKQVKILDQEFQDFLSKCEPMQRRNPWSRLTHVLTTFSLITFIAGISSLCRFAYSNLPRPAGSNLSLSNSISVQTNIGLSYSNLPEL